MFLLASDLGCEKSHGPCSCSLSSDTDFSLLTFTGMEEELPDSVSSNLIFLLLSGEGDMTSEHKFLLIALEFSLVSST